MKPFDFRSLPRAKRFPVIAVLLGLCAVLGVVLATQITAKKLTRELQQITPFSPSAPESTAAQQELFDVPDPRVTAPTTALPPQTTAAPETTAAPTTTAPTTAAPQTAAAAGTIRNESFVLPIENTSVSKGYSPHAPVFSATMGDWRVHGGVDFAAEENSAVLAVGNGVVTKVSADTAWGYVIEIDHGSFTARYCSVSQENAVKIGDTVQAGEQIGTLATPPLEHEDAPHLHFETLQDGKAVYPLEAMEMS